MVVSDGNSTNSAFSFYSVSLPCDPRSKGLDQSVSDMLMKLALSFLGQSLVPISFFLDWLTVPFSSFGGTAIVNFCAKSSKLIFLACYAFHSHYQLFRSISANYFDYYEFIASLCA